MKYFTSEGNIRPELFDQEAVKVADGILRIKPTQMRRIFDQIKQLRRRLDAGEVWEKILPLIKLQKAQMAYTIRRGKISGGRDRENDWKNLELFMNDGLDSVKTAEDYAAFTDMMEAVYAYHYARTTERD